MNKKNIIFFIFLVLIPFIYSENFGDTFIGGGITKYGSGNLDPSVIGTEKNSIVTTEFNWSVTGFDNSGSYNSNNRVILTSNIGLTNNNNPDGSVQSIYIITNLSEPYDFSDATFNLSAVQYCSGGGTAEKDTTFNLFKADQSCILKIITSGSSMPYMEYGGSSKGCTHTCNMDTLTGRDYYNSTHQVLLQQRFTAADLNAQCSVPLSALKNIMFIGFGMKPDTCPSGGKSNFLVGHINFSGVQRHNNSLPSQIVTINTSDLCLNKSFGYLDLDINWSVIDKEGDQIHYAINDYDFIRKYVHWKEDFRVDTCSQDLEVFQNPRFFLNDSWRIPDDFLENLQNQFLDTRFSVGADVSDIGDCTAHMKPAMTMTERFGWIIPESFFDESLISFEILFQRSDFIFDQNALFLVELLDSYTNSVVNITINKTDYNLKVDFFNIEIFNENINDTLENSHPVTFNLYLNYSESSIGFDIITLDNVNFTVQYNETLFGVSSIVFSNIDSSSSQWWAISDITYQGYNYNKNPNFKTVKPGFRVNHTADYILDFYVTDDANLGYNYSMVTKYVSIGYCDEVIFDITKEDGIFQIGSALGKFINSIGLDNTVNSIWYWIFIIIFIMLFFAVDFEFKIAFFASSFIMMFLTLFGVGNYQHSLVSIIMFSLSLVPYLIRIWL